MQIPLFPLATVLFPQGMMPLRIFEPRYLGMVGNCMREGSQFGVVLIVDGQEAGKPGRFHTVGTLATIEDFDQLEDGNLGITCRGSERFRVVEYRVQDDLLVTATVEPFRDSSEQPLPGEFPAMQRYVRQLCEREELSQWRQTIKPDWNSGEWLGCRLCELLPLDMASRQALLEMDQVTRLKQLAEVMVKNNLLAGQEAEPDG